MDQKYIDALFTSLVMSVSDVIAGHSFEIEGVVNALHRKNLLSDSEVDEAKKLAPHGHLEGLSGKITAELQKRMALWMHELYGDPGPVQ